MPNRKYQRAFTLLEVIVALAVIAFALAAGVSAVSGSTRNAAGLEQRTYAHWVAMNKMAELQISSEWPGIDTTRGSDLLAGHEWFWSVTVSEVPGDERLKARMRRVDIRVRVNEGDETPLVTLTGFLGKPS